MNCSRILGTRKFAPADRIKASRATVMGLALLVALWALAFGAAAYRNDAAPDLLADEVLYYRVADNVAELGEVMWDNGKNIYVHPPLFFLTQAAYLRLRGIRDHSVFDGVYAARGLNAALGALTAVALVLVAWRVGGIPAALVTGALFVLDPFVVRINRRNMLETMTGLLMVMGLYGELVFFANRSAPDSAPARNALGLFVPHSRTRQWLKASVIGLVLGAALLTKELAFLALLAVWSAVGVELLVRLVRRKETSPPAPLLQGKGSLVISAVALLVWGLFPLWAFWRGEWDMFVEEKTVSLLRLVGALQLTGWNRPGVSLLQAVEARLPYYASSYLVLGLGALAIGWLLWQGRTRGEKLIAGWGVTSYGFFVFTAWRGAANDQFFYFWLLPAIIALACALPQWINPPVLRLVFPQRLVQALFAKPRLAQLASILLTSAAVALVGALLLFNATRWYYLFGVGRDDVYRQLTTFTETQLETDTVINSSGDDIRLPYFLSDYPISHIRTVEEAEQGGVHYFVASTKDTQVLADNWTPEFANWILAHGTPVFLAYGDTYWWVGLYRIE